MILLSQKIKRGKQGKKGKMFILDIGIGAAKSLIMKLLKKLSKMDKLNHNEQTKIEGKCNRDEFVFNTEREECSATVKDCIGLLLQFLGDEISTTSDSKFIKYLESLKKGLTSVMSGDLAQKLKSNSFVNNLDSCLKDILDYCKKKQSGGDDSWKKATDSLATISALNPFVALAKLIKIASNSSYPKEIRAFAAALINDALSHMKQQSVTNSSARLLIGLLNNTPSDVRDLVFSALKDSKTIERNSHFPDRHNVTPFKRNLTLA